MSPINRILVTRFVGVVVLFNAWMSSSVIFCAIGQEPELGRSVLDGPIEIQSKKKAQSVSMASKVDQSGADTAVSRDAGEEIDALITKLVLSHLPHEFKQDKDWGKTDERFDGLKVRRNGLKIYTKRKKKTVNHGNWKKYKVTLVDPAQQFRVSVKNMREATDGKVAFDLHCRSDLKIEGRVAKWVKGLQLYSVSVDGEAVVKLAVTIELETAMDVAKFPPDLVFRPEAKDATLELEKFKIDRISKVGGEVAQQATRWARSAIEERLESEQRKLVQKINRDLKKNADKMRLSLHDAVSSKWSKVATEFMPADVRTAAQGGK